MDIENKIDLYLSDDNEIDEGIGNLLGKGVKATGKGVSDLIEFGFDALVKKVSDELAISAQRTSFDKIGKIKNKEKQLKALEKKAAFHKESFIKVIYRIEELNN